MAGEKRVLVLTFVRAEQVDLAANFLAHAKAAGMISVLLAVGLDDTSSTLIQRHGVALYRVRTRGLEASRSMPAAPAACAIAEDWLEGDTFGPARWRYLSTLTRAGLHVWVSDVRTLWLREPLMTWSPPTGCDVALISDAPFGHERVSLRSNNRSLSEHSDVHSRSLSLALGLHRSTLAVSSWHLRVAHRLSDHDGPEHEVLSDELAACSSASANVKLPRRTAVAGIVPSRLADHCPRWCATPRTQPLELGLKAFIPRTGVLCRPRSSRTAYSTSSSVCHTPPRLLCNLLPC